MVYTICIGSDERWEDNLALARKKLPELFSDIRFSAEVDIQLLFFCQQAPFANQVTRFMPDCNIHEIILCLKDVGREAGRISKEKRQEIVCPGIDLLSCDNRVYKPEDLERDHIVRGLEELDEKIQLNCINKVPII